MRVAKFLGAPTDHYVPFPHVGKEVDQSSSLANDVPLCCWILLCAEGSVDL